MRDVGYKPPNCGVGNAGTVAFITGIIKQLVRNSFRVSVSQNYFDIC